MTAPVGSQAGRRGGPLVMLLLVLALWTGGRALWWENPFAVIVDALGEPLASVTTGPGIIPPASDLPTAADLMTTLPSGGLGAADMAALGLSVAAIGARTAALAAPGLPRRGDPQLAAAHQMIWFAAMRETAAYSSGLGNAVGFARPYASAAASASGIPAAGPPPATGRWSLDGWAFWRQGSDAAPVSQGRVPIYGASQVGAVLQYRLAPASRRDPRVFARAYRALVRRGEQELAAGASVRPVGRVPVRVAAEARWTDTAFARELRPAAYAVTELPTVGLPLGLQLEAYGQAGWVGGDAATPFADGQAVVTREVRAVAGASDDRLRFSLGAGAWGGAQNDAQRFDIGPTMRVDLTVGDVPARLSVDWRERVGGQAGPDSGLAATLSTRF